MSENSEPENFIGMSEDRQHAIVKLDVGLNAADLDDLIMKLADLRANLEPAHQLEAPLRKFRPLLWTHWYCMAEVMNNDTVLMFRHPGYGWLPFRLDRETRQKLIEEMTKESQAEPATRPMN